ncbi:E3 ubiquitin-protein ligase RNF144B-like [Alosa pseudoharengus]|uniref:E3 ubiquitin-protein ligase RNF144B-like n=1 Tax=Alosa pseudoharengus TaxID=34774 RepID=UPI003F8B8406
MGAGKSTPNEEEVVVTHCNVRESLQRPAEQTRPQKPIQVDADVNKCPTCSSVLHMGQGTDWQASPVAQCTNCPTKPYLCATCLYPWQGSPGVLGHCANKRCAVVGNLLTCGLITDTNSPVKGCPEFRACPKCYSLLMHNNKGCNNVICLQCHHDFCYICLRSSEECWKAIHLLSSDHSKPAARQQFHV